MEEQKHIKLTRSEARKSAFMILFEQSFRKDEPIDDIIQTAIELRAVKVDEYVQEAVLGALSHSIAIAEYIDKYSIGWKSQRISKVDKAIMTLAIYEMLFDDNVPVSVAINEAVEISKEFSSNESSAFINGILGSVAKEAEQADG